MSASPAQPGVTSPSLTPEVIDLTEKSPVKRPGEEIPILERAKRHKPTATEIPLETPSPSEEAKKPTKKDLDKLERQKKREEERLEKERQKEEDRRLKEEERKRKLEQKEAEKASRRKKIEEEKLEKERKREEEKLEKERKKEEEKLEKERKKEEERLEKERKKEEERLERERRKEEERVKKEEKKRKADEEKKKAEEAKKKAEEAKDRSQMKISSFFQVKLKTDSSPQKQAKELAASNILPSAVAPDENGPAEASASLYSKTFLPFFQKQNVVLAASATLSDEDLLHSKGAFDDLLQPKHASLTIAELRTSFKVTAAASKLPYNTPQQIIEALNTSQATEEQIYSMFQNMPPVKYLQFYENAKPPYVGTWCSEAHKSIQLPTSNPFERSMTGFDYDYDSDLDWDGEDEDGEDIDEDDDEEEDEPLEDDGEMEDFVEGNDVKKSKKFLGPLVAVCQWNGGADKGAAVFDEIKYERLDVSIEYSIDPNFDYWGASKGATELKEPDMGLTSSNVSPSRAPAGQLPNTLTPQKQVIKDSQTLYQLIQFVEKNNDFTIGTLVELSKKEFKAFTKAILRHTIQEIACYNKKTSNWEVKEPLKKKLVGELGILA